MRKELLLPIYFKGDIVKLKSGESGEVIDTWGVARHWYKVKLDKKIHCLMASEIDSIVSRPKDQKKKNPWK